LRTRNSQGDTKWGEKTNQKGGGGKEKKATLEKQRGGAQSGKKAKRIKLDKGGRASAMIQARDCCQGSSKPSLGREEGAGELGRKYDEKARVSGRATRGI